MVDHAEVIRQQMEETRANLSDKLEALETQVTETVQSATEAVSETVESVKETVENVTSAVEETVHSVSDFFDLRGHTERHPWVVFGSSVALGCLTAQLFGGEKNRGERTDRWADNPAIPDWREAPASSNQRPGLAGSAAGPSSPSEPAAPAKTSWLWDELGRIKGLAVGALMGVVRDMAARGLQGELGKRVAEEVDSLTTHLGGQPFHGSVLPEK